MWHRKGKNFLLLTEIFFSFLVLFATLSLVIKELRNYYTPIGFDYQDVYVIDIDRHGEGGARAWEKMKQIRNELRSMPEIANYSLSGGNLPYSFTISNTSILFQGKEAISHSYTVEPSYFETMDLELSAGRWLQKGDVGEVPPVVINEKLARELFKDENPVGQTLTGQEGEARHKVVGVIRHFRQDGEFSDPEAVMFRLFNEADTTGQVASSILVEVKGRASPGWQQRLMDRATDIGGNWSFEETSMAEMRAIQGRIDMIPLVALSIVCAFLIFNVALGLYGVLWYNISKRFSEIGIRRAVGATRLSIRWQMVGEVLVLATFGLLLGLLLAVQFPLLGVFNVETSIYALAIAGSLFLIYLLVIICAWYPGRQASVIEPSDALHYE